MARLARGGQGQFGYDRKGHVLVAYPATVGSRELPSPSGTYKVKGVAYNPIYYYDPDKNFVQGHDNRSSGFRPVPTIRRFGLHRLNQADLRPARHTRSLED